MIEYQVKVSKDRTEYFLNGRYHREDGPAIEYVSGTKKWYLDDKKHREDGPACELANGTKEWFLDGKRHREDGPAIEFVSGTKKWFLNGKRHREGGPAIEYADGTKDWYLDGKEVTESEVMGHKDLTIKQIEETLEYKVKVYENRTEWFLNGELHREDGPAIEWASGTKEWYINGEEVSESEVIHKELTVKEIEDILGYRVKVIK